MLRCRNTINIIGILAIVLTAVALVGCNEPKNKVKMSNIRYLDEDESQEQIRTLKSWPDNSYTEDFPELNNADSYSYTEDRDNKMYVLYIDGVSKKRMEEYIDNLQKSGVETVGYIHDDKNKNEMIEYTGTKDKCSISISFCDDGCVISFMEQ